MITDSQTVKQLLRTRSPKRSRPIKRPPKPPLSAALPGGARALPVTALPRSARCFPRRPGLEQLSLPCLSLTGSPRISSRCPWRGAHACASARAARGGCSWQRGVAPGPSGAGRFGSTLLSTSQCWSKELPRHKAAPGRFPPCGLLKLVRLWCSGSETPEFERM